MALAMYHDSYTEAETAGIPESATETIGDAESPWPDLVNGRFHRQVHEIAEIGAYYRKGGPEERVFPVQFGLDQNLVR